MNWHPGSGHCVSSMSLRTRRTFHSLSKFSEHPFLDLSPSTFHFSSKFSPGHLVPFPPMRCRANTSDTSGAGKLERPCARRRRPRRQVVDRAAPVRPHLQGLRDPGALSVERAGDPRPRPARLRDEPLLRLLGRLQERPGHRRDLGVRLRRPRPRRHRRARRLPDAARRRVNIRWPDAVARAGSADAGLQELRGARTTARVNRLNQHRHRRAEAAPRHHHQRQELPRRARRRWTTSASTSATAADIGIRLYKVGDVVAARADGVREFAEGPRGDPRRRGKAPGHRVPAEGSSSTTGATTCARACVGKFDETGRVGAVAPAPASTGCCRAHGRADAGDDRARDRAAARQARRRRRRSGAHRASASRSSTPRRSALAQAAASRPARARRTSARAARTTPRPRCPKAAARTAGIGCHFMAIWMDRDTVDLHPDGRRRRAVGRPGAVHRREAHLREPRRRHLLPLGPAGDPRRRSRPRSTSPTRSSTTTRSR